MFSVLSLLRLCAFFPQINFWNPGVMKQLPISFNKLKNVGMSHEKQQNKYPWHCKICHRTKIGNIKMAIDAGYPISRVRESWKVCQSWQQQQEMIVCIGYYYATFLKQTLLCHKVNSCKLHGSREWWSLSCVMCVVCVCVWCVCVCGVCVCIADKLTGKALPVRAQYTSIHECDDKLRKSRCIPLLKTKQNIIILLLC